MTDSNGRTGRRRLLQAGGLLGASALAGCIGRLTGNDDEDGEVTLSDFRGSGPLVSSRAEPEGTRVADLPELSGTLSVYLGGGEGGLYVQLFDLFKRLYPDFDVQPKVQPSSQLANQLISESEAGQTQADVFVSVDAGSLGLVADAGATADLPENARSQVPAEFRDPENQWVGIAGRARAVPYNTNALSESDVPSDIYAFAEDDRFADAMGWAPDYSAFISMVTAMRLIDGREKAKSWLEGMQSQNATQYKDEFFASNGVADGEVQAAFANHYYALRVQSDRPDAPIDLAFTKNDPGALVNVSGASVVDGSDQQELATNFVRHLLSAEAQEFFATRTFAYPMIPGVEPVGGLPAIDELAPPDLDLAKLADAQPTISLMKEVGVL
jgi:iron(III) transport system substrate-binding protein